MFKLPWEKLEILTEKSEQRIESLESKSKEVLNKIIDYEKDSRSLEKKHDVANGKIAVIQEYTYESELENISILRRLDIVESKLIEIEFMNLQHAEQKKNRWRAMLDFIVATPSFVKRLAIGHHLLISSILLMTVAAAGIPVPLTVMPNLRILVASIAIVGSLL